MKHTFINSTIKSIAIFMLIGFILSLIVIKPNHLEFKYKNISVSMEKI